MHRSQTLKLPKKAFRTGRARVPGNVLTAKLSRPVLDCALRHFWMPNGHGQTEPLPDLPCQGASCSGHSSLDLVGQSSGWASVSDPGESHCQLPARAWTPQTHAQIGGMHAKRLQKALPA